MECPAHQSPDPKFHRYLNKQPPSPYSQHVGKAEGRGRLLQEGRGQGVTWKDAAKLWRCGWGLKLPVQPLCFPWLCPLGSCSPCFQWGAVCFLCPIWPVQVLSVPSLGGGAGMLAPGPAPTTEAPHGPCSSGAARVPGRGRLLLCP